MAFQLLSGLASGTFIPLTIGFVVLNLPRRLVVYGVAAYAMNLELSLNIAASIEGWFSDNWSWKWIFWDTALLTPLMLLCIHFGMPRQPVNRELLKTADWAGILYASLGFSLLYAALDQGNRLDWLNSGLINALLLGGGLLLVAFVVQELTHDRPWINLRFAVSGNIPLLFLLITFFRFVILSTSYIIPQFLTTVQNFRAIEIGGVSDLDCAAAIPACTPRRDDFALCRTTRLPLALGFALVGCGCFMAGQLTQDWAGDDFLPSQIVQAVGQSIGLTSLVWFFLKHLEPSQVLDLRRGAADRATVRGAAGLGLHPDLRSRAGAGLFESGRAACHGRLDRHRPTVAGLCARLDRTLGRPRRGQCTRDRAAGRCGANQAYVLAYIDGFMVLGFAAIGVLLLMVFLRAPPAQPGPRRRAKLTLANEIAGERDRIDRQLRASGAADGHPCGGQVSGHALDPLRTRRPRLERVAEILGLSGHLPIEELHDAHGVLRAARHR